MGKTYLICPINEVLISLIYKGKNIKKEKATEDRNMQNTQTAGAQK